MVIKNRFTDGVIFNSVDLRGVANRMMREVPVSVLNHREHRRMIFEVNLSILKRVTG